MRERHCEHHGFRGAARGRQRRGAEKALGPTLFDGQLRLGCGLSRRNANARKPDGAPCPS